MQSSSSKTRSQLLFLIALTLFQINPVDANSYQVSLPSGNVLLSEQTTEEFLLARQASTGHYFFGLAALKTFPTPAERAALESEGVKVEGFYDENVYEVRIDDAFDKPHPLVDSLIDAFYLLKAEDKVTRNIWVGFFDPYVADLPGSGKTNYVLNVDGSVNLLAQFYPSIPRPAIEPLLQQITRNYEPLSDSVWSITLSIAAMHVLAGENAVRWLDAGRRPFVPTNDVARAVLFVDPVQQFSVITGTPNGVGGAGVQVGVFDTGIDNLNKDLAPRVVASAPVPGEHATHVAGTIAGSGFSSNRQDSWLQNNGGTPYQWRGMAPEAEVLDLSYAGATTASVMWNAISAQKMDVSNHSYVVSFDGVYDSDTAYRDDTIRGDTTWNLTAIPPRLQVYSAGNYGQAPESGHWQSGYFSLVNQTKNGLLVGGVDRNGNVLWPDTSLGPTYDGRIKPDVVASATVVSTEYCQDMPPHLTPVNPCANALGLFVRQDFYFGLSGTSMSAAATTGVVALVLEQYASSFGVDLDVDPPLPSTLRATIVQTATDIVGPIWFGNRDGPVQAFPGPDFVSGYGLVNARGATSLIKAKALIEDSLSATCDTRMYQFTVPGSATGPLKVTLAWDDVAGTPGLPETTPKLKNDLDLVLIAPDGHKHYPWLLNQRTVDGSGAPISNDQQRCGSKITVQRPFLPSPKPQFFPDPLPPGGLQPASRGVDHLNTLEQVEVDNPKPGKWLAVVQGFRVPLGPQPFSLVGIKFQPQTIWLDPWWFCRKHPLACAKIFPVDLCPRLPWLCEPTTLDPIAQGFRIKFRANAERIILPLDALCSYLASSECTDGYISSLDAIRFAGLPPGLTMELISSSGQSVQRDSRAMSGRTIKVPSERTSDYFLVLSPTGETVLNRPYDVVVTAQER